MWEIETFLLSFWTKTESKGAPHLYKWHLNLLQFLSTQGHFRRFGRAKTIFWIIFLYGLATVWVFPICKWVCSILPHNKWSGTVMFIFSVPPFSIFWSSLIGLYWFSNVEMPSLLLLINFLQYVHVCCVVNYAFICALYMMDWLSFPLWTDSSGHMGSSPLGSPTSHRGMHPSLLSPTSMGHSGSLHSPISTLSSPMNGLASPFSVISSPMGPHSMTSPGMGYGPSVSPQVSPRTDTDACVHALLFATVNLEWSQSWRMCFLHLAENARHMHTKFLYLYIFFTIFHSFFLLSGWEKKKLQLSR